jgi:hypothetical protein
MGSLCLMKNGFWPSFHNQALLAGNRSLSAGINYENRFGINELSTKTAGLIIPAGSSSLGILYSHFGYNYFRRELAGLSCGIVLSKNISAGIQIDYLSEKTSGEYESSHSLTFEAGMTLKPKENVIIGIHIFNPVPNSLRKTCLPARLLAGAGIELNNVLFTGAEAEISTGNSLLMRMGFDYKVHPKFHLRGGFCTQNTSFSFGMGYLLKSLQIDLAFATHEKLGITSSASLIFRLH